MSFAPAELSGFLRFGKFRRFWNMPWYAVVRGLNPGVYDSWDKCKHNTDGYPKASFKSFKTHADALDFLQQNNVHIQGNGGKDNSASSTDTVTLMDSDDEVQVSSEPGFLPNKPQAESGHNTFDFALFSQRLTNLEDTYKQKMKELEERIEALESARLLHNCDDNDFSTDSNTVAEPKPSHSETSLKRSSSKTDFQGSTKKKPKTSGSIRITSNDGSTYEFEADEDGFVKVYTDGACSKNGRYNSKAGVGVWFGENHPLNISEPVQGRATNNMAEIQAATWAIQQSIKAGVKKICVLTDSQFLINCITLWMKRWKKNGWKTNSGDAVNREELEVLDKVCNYPGINIKWEYVPAHKKILGNESADCLAKKGAKLYKPGSFVVYPWQEFCSL